MRARYTKYALLPVPVDGCHNRSVLELDLEVVMPQYGGISSLGNSASMY
jgi:hypothetical protein